MSRLNYLPAAVGDLDEIYFYIGQHDEEAARRMLDRIYRAAVRLERFPLSAPARSEIGEGIRSLAVKDYLLIYRVEDDRVDVLRVVHGSRDVAALLDD